VKGTEMKAIEVENISKQYGSFYAVKNWKIMN